MSDFNINKVPSLKIYFDAVDELKIEQKSKLDYHEIIGSNGRENLVSSLNKYFIAKKSEFLKNKEKYLSDEYYKKIKEWNSMSKKIGAACVGLIAGGTLGYYLLKDSESNTQIVGGAITAGVVTGGVSYVVTDKYTLNSALNYLKNNPITDSPEFDEYIYSTLKFEMKRLVHECVSSKLLQREDERKKTLYDNQKKELLEKIKLEEENIVLNPDKILSQATEACKKNDKKLKKLELERKKLKNQLKCPITGELFEYPVCAPDGHVYEQKSLQDHFQKQSIEISLGMYSRREFKFPTCPKDMTKQLYNPLDLSRDHNTHLKMNEYKELLERKKHLQDKFEKRDSFVKQLLEERENNKSARAPKGDISIPR